MLEWAIGIALIVVMGWAVIRVSERFFRLETMGDLYRIAAAGAVGAFISGWANGYGLVALIFAPFGAIGLPLFVLFMKGLDSSTEKRKERD